jgi:hypothetical protein
MTAMLNGAAAVILAAASLGLTVSPALSHQAKSGWTYPLECCSDRDCQEVPETAISMAPEGFVIGPTGETLGYSDPRLRDSPDGVYHWCSVGQAANTRTLCLFVPPQLY